MKSSKIIALIIAAAALLWIGSGFLMAEDKPDDAKAEVTEENQEKALQQVRVRTIQAQLYEDEIIVTGRTQASREVIMKAEISGEISKVLKEEGQQVPKDEVLAELDLRDRKAREIEARGRVEQRQIEYNAAKQLADKGFNSKVRLAQAAADLESAKSALRAAQVDLDKVEIKAPFDGTINMQAIEKGDYVSVGEEMFTIVDLDPIEAAAYISERRVQEVEKGQPAHAEFLNGDKIDATVSYIAAAADDQTRTFRVIISAENPEKKIRDGLTAKIRIPVADRKAHKISPSILALDDVGKIGVKIVNAENKVEFVPVTILADKSDAMWISGPAETARFITVGQEFVIEGQLVEPVEAEGDGLL